MIPRGAANDFLLRLPFLFYFPRTRKTSEAAAVWLDEVCRCGAFFSGGSAEPSGRAMWRAPSGQKLESLWCIQRLEI